MEKCKITITMNDGRKVEMGELSLPLQSINSCAQKWLDSFTKNKFVNVEADFGNIVIKSDSVNLIEFTKSEE